MRRATGLLLIVTSTLATLGMAAWGALALWFQAPFGESVRAAPPAIWTIAVLALLVMALRGRARFAWPALAGLAVAILAWWSTILPSNGRDWAPDVARTAAARVEGAALVVENVRDFVWRSDEDFDERWETRRYDLDRIAGADLFLSYWAGEAIAHAIVSFTFDGSPPLAFSIEIRRRRGEQFSSVAGFFRSYELAFIAADERDVVKVRSTVRHEDVRLYRIDIRPQTARRLLMSYVAMANEAASSPRWYNSLTTNCTTVIFGMARVLDPGVPRDWRVLFSGYLPGYLYDAGFLRRDAPLKSLVAQSHIAAKAPGPADDPDFSRRIREGVPQP
jgi:hypothetical protein